MGTLRISTGRHTTLEEMEKAAALIVEEVGVLSKTGGKNNLWTVLRSGAMMEEE